MRDWLMRLLRGSPTRDRSSDAVKESLTSSQTNVADRLAKMRGQTRDQVLAEAYRRADRTLARRR